MKLTSPLVSLLALIQTASAAECGKWYSSKCVCETDIKYCKDGEGGASDDIKDQHPFWSHYEGFYNYTAHTFMMGLYNSNEGMFDQFPYHGYMNQTISGSRTYNHRYNMMAPNPDFNCSNAPGFEFVGECGVNGLALNQDGFGTGTPERDGSLVTTLALQPSAGNDDGMSITDEDAEYKQVPIDENTLFGSAKSNRFLVTETFSFTDENKTEASAVQDVYMTMNNKTTLVSSIRMTFTRLDAQSFEDGIKSMYDETNIPDAMRVPVPITKSCNQETCPTEEDFCEIDPRCTAAVKYEEPDASIEAGPIVGIVVAAFVVVIILLYMVHLKAMKEQAARNQAVFARRIAETIKLEGPDRGLTPEALAEEFKKIDNGNVDGSIDKEELWAFVNSGKAAKMNRSDFNALFAALDIDGDGTVSFMEFSAYMGKAYGDFEKMKSQKSVKMARGAMMDNYYIGVSKRLISIPINEEEEKKEEEKDEEKP